MSSVPPTNSIAMSSDQTSYATSSAIIVTITNHRSTSIFTFDHQTGCTILSLQRQTASGWENTGGCSMGRATQRIEIKAGETKQVTLSPGAGQIHPTPWPAGTYQAVLRYALAAQDMEAGLVVATPLFTIH